MNKLIIFDCDGTLVDSEIIAAQVFPQVWATMGLSMSSDDFICKFVGTSSDAPIVKETLALLPPDAMQIADHQFEAELAQRLQPVRGMTELLQNLSSPVCVASNSSSGYLKNVLEKTNLAPFFGNRVYSAHQVARRKPAPDVFLFAADQLGFSAKDCVVIEDSVPGIQAAKSAGMKVVGFMGGLHFNDVIRARLFSAQADHYCDSVQQLEEILRCP